MTCCYACVSNVLLSAPSDVKLNQRDTSERLKRSAECSLGTEVTNNIILQGIPRRVSDTWQQRELEISLCIDDW
jgi:hypothetical protein